MKNLFFFVTVFVTLTSCYNESVQTISEEEAVLKRVDLAFTVSDPSLTLVQLCKLDTEVSVFSIASLIMKHPYGEGLQKGDYHYGYRFSTVEFEALKKSDTIKQILRERSMIIFLNSDLYTVLSLEADTIKFSASRPILNRKEGLAEAKSVNDYIITEKVKSTKNWTPVIVFGIAGFVVIVILTFKIIILPN